MNGIVSGDYTPDHSQNRAEKSPEVVKRNGSTFNLITGQERSEQKTVFQKKRFQLENSNPIIADQSCIDDDEGLNPKNYGRMSIFENSQSI